MDKQLVDGQRLSPLQQLLSALPALLSHEDVIETTGLTRQQLYSARRAAGFPTPFCFGKYLVWSPDDVAAAEPFFASASGVTDAQRDAIRLREHERLIELNRCLDRTRQIIDSCDEELFTFDGKTIRGVVSLSHASRRTGESPIEWWKLPCTYQSARHEHRLGRLPMLASSPGRHIKIQSTRIVEANLEQQIEVLNR